MSLEEITIEKKIYEEDWLETEHTTHSLPPCT